MSKTVYIIFKSFIRKVNPFISFDGVLVQSRFQKQIWW